MNRSLVEIFADKETDKNDNGISQIYDELWEEYRYGVRSMLEIGVDRAGSIQGWLEFFPEAMIYGIDIRPSGFEHPRYVEHVGDVINGIPFPVPFDIVIDDGSHMYDDIHSAFHELWSRVTPGGYYVIEDIQVPYNAPKTPHPFVDWAMHNDVELKIERHNLMWLRKGV